MRAAGPGKDESLLSHLSAHDWTAMLRARATASLRRDVARSVCAAALSLWLAAASWADGIAFPPTNPLEPVSISANEASRWQQGDYEVLWLRGQCAVRQGFNAVQGTEAVVWIRRGGEYGDRRNLVIAYFEGQPVRFEFSEQGKLSTLTESTWLGDFRSTAPLQMRIAQISPEPSFQPAIYQRGMQRRAPSTLDTNVQPAQFAAPASPAAGTRRLRVFPRSGSPLETQFFSDPQAAESIALITGGVNFIVDGLVSEIQEIDEFDITGIIDVSADRLVIWTAPDLLSDFSGSGETLQRDDAPLEIYMEGNIVFRQGDRLIQAHRMYYDVKQQTGIVIQADVLTPVPNYQGLLRLKADVLRQTGPGRFFATGAFLTSSRLGSPGYRLQSSNVYFEDNQTPVRNPLTGAPEINPVTMEPLVAPEKLATSYNNFLYLRDVPVIYWPVLATDLEEPTYYIERFQVKQDRIFGLQILTELDAYQVFGISNPPVGTDWNLAIDYLRDRGLGVGTSFEYARHDLFGWGEPYNGVIDAWAIKDSGLDELGSDRRSLIPEKEFRHRVLWRHRHFLPSDIRLSAELGWTSDRNFLEQYFEREWDEFKDQTTGVEAKHVRENMSVSVTADHRINDFFTQTEWLPRGDHFWLGQPLLGDTLSWFEHTQVGFARLRTASTPTDPADAAKFAPLPWEATSSGERLVTRQEIDLPVQLGVVKVVPYALGELAHWGEDLTGDDLQRAYGQVGLRASVPFWTADPTVESHLFNVHGVAHKAVLDGEFSYADATRDLAMLPLYDPLDDDAVEHFRRRFAFNTFGGPAPVPPAFDERFYALRYGLGGWVTSPSAEIADDLTAVRLGARQRWQTKRGLPGSRRIIDWIVLDTNLTWFPEDDRDNFGEDFGLLDYSFLWHVGDRVTLVSDGAFDFFAAGQQLVTVGAFLVRPPRGRLFVGYRSLEGPFSSQILIASYNYRMSAKWVSEVSTSVDVAGNGNIGQHVRITRIGESFLVSLGANIDANKDNVGVNLLVEPRFLPVTALGRAGGAQIPVAGLRGLE